MRYWEIFLAFFIPGILGYGGGPASIPLVENEVVSRYGWLSVSQFSEVLALGNALPGPIATKMAGYIGFMEGGVLGAFIGIFATVAPSLVLMITMLGVLYKHKNSPKVKLMTALVRPTIAILLGVMAYKFFFNSFQGIGGLQTVSLVIISFLLLKKWKLHPVYVIIASLVYGGFFLA